MVPSPKNGWNLKFYQTVISNHPTVLVGKACDKSLGPRFHRKLFSTLSSVCQFEISFNPWDESAMPFSERYSSKSGKCPQTFCVFFWSELKGTWVVEWKKMNRTKRKLGRNTENKEEEKRTEQNKVKWIERKSMKNEILSHNFNYHSSIQFHLSCVCCSFFLSFIRLLWVCLGLHVCAYTCSTCKV